VRYSAETAPIGDWFLGSCSPGKVPAGFRRVISAHTVAAAWSEWGLLDLDDRSTLERIDGQDHHWRAKLPDHLHAEAMAGRRVVLELPGLATIAEVRLNSELLAESESMFIPLEVDLTDALSGDDTLEVIIRSLTSYLEAAKWPRPRWKTRLVSDQRLRNVRTALVGRVGWAPPTPIAGPYGGAQVHVLDGSEVHSSAIATSLVGDVGIVSVVVDCGPRVRVGIEIGALTKWLEPEPGNRWRGELRIDGVSKWFPHTHGEPALFDVKLILAPNGTDDTTHVVCDPIGFRSITVDETDGGFEVAVNGISVFCRGAVAMPFDVVGAKSDPAALRSRLEMVRTAGMNMIRLGGTNSYESEELHRLCDELGIMVWQDLPFASLDYPSTPEFQTAVQRELHHHVPRLRAHPSTAMICASSEGEQQAAMMGISPEVIAQTPGQTWIRELMTTLAPEIHYVASSPTGGHLPMRVDTGIAHYFGVGAYRRGLDDATLSGVRFASECLAFANIPSSSVLHTLGPIEGEYWKSRVPRDSGSDWDFDDVRDHYVCALINVSIDLKLKDPERWLRLSEVIPGEIMASTFRTWRSGTACSGGLVLSLNDVWPSAGWGLLDSSGNAKASLQRLAQVLQPLALLAVDRGLNGLDLHLINETDTSVEGYLAVRAVDRRGRSILKGSNPIRVDAHASVVVPAESVLGRFADPTYAYRFGAQPFDAVVAVFSPENPDDERNPLEPQDLDSAYAYAMHVISPQWVSEPSDEVSIVVSAVAASPNGVRVTVESAGINRFLTVSAEGATSSIGQLDLGPGQRRSIELSWPVAFERPTTGRVRVIEPNHCVDFSIPAESVL
jgi:beta-mannosidase